MKMSIERWWNDTGRGKPSLESKIIRSYMLSLYRAVNTVSVIKTSQSMLYREIIAVCSEIHTKHINTLCGQNVELLNA
jgi:hypothetical protein